MLIVKEIDAIKIIKESISEFFPESSVVLFGSRARHDNTEDSDYDLMIITQDEHENKEVRLLKSIIRKKLARNKIPADIIIQSKVEIEIKKKITGHIIRQVLKEGVLI